MPVLENLLTVAEAAEELGLSASAIRQAIKRGFFAPKRLGRRVNLIPRAQVEEYRAKHLGQWGRGKRPQPDDLTEQQRKQRAYQAAYYQRRKAARQQPPATEPAE